MSPKRAACGVFVAVKIASTLVNHSSEELSGCPLKTGIAVDDPPLFRLIGADWLSAYMNSLTSDWVW